MSRWKKVLATGKLSGLARGWVKLTISGILPYLEWLIRASHIVREREGKLNRARLTQKR
jgi:hypothetical protein